MIFLASGQQGACVISLEWHMVFWAPGHQVSLCHLSSMAHEHFSIWPPGRKGFFSSLSHDLFGIWMGHFSSMAHDLLGTWPPDRMCHLSSIILYDHSGHLTTYGRLYFGHHVGMCHRSRTPYNLLFKQPCGSNSPIYLTFRTSPYRWDRKTYMEEDSGRNSENAIFITQVLNTFVCNLLRFLYFLFYISKHSYLNYFAAVSTIFINLKCT